MHDPPIYPWHPPYIFAVLETDKELMPKRIDDALKALSDRSQTETDDAEREEIRNARRGLLTLQAEQLGDAVSNQDMQS